VPENYYSIPLGKAALIEEGDELSIITYGTMVHVALAAVRQAGIRADIIDVRTLVPLDVETLKLSVEKTGRCLIAHEASKFCGYGAELAATVQEECFWHLQAPIVRVAGWETPYPHAFEWDYFPGQDRIMAGIRSIMESV
jgi:2-oxoisovalerate dehydrogenase E1 component beta subunit